MAFLLTFITYGTHLPGSELESFDHVRKGKSHAWRPDPEFESFNRSRMKQPEFHLANPEQRALVRDAIVEVCRHRSWVLYALHVRSTHVHIVLETPSPERSLNDFKSYATRALRKAGLAATDRIVWGHSGHSQRALTSERLAGAVRYVLEQQGEPMEVYSMYQR